MFQCKLPTVLETLYRLPRNILIVQIAFLVLEPLVPVVRFLKHLKRVTIQMSILYQQRWFRHRLRLRWYIIKQKMKGFINFCYLMCLTAWLNDSTQSVKILTASLKSISLGKFGPIPVLHEKRSLSAPLIFKSFQCDNNKNHRHALLVGVVGDHESAQYPNRHQF